MKGKIKYLNHRPVTKLNLKILQNKSNSLAHHQKQKITKSAIVGTTNHLVPHIQDPYKRLSHLLRIIVPYNIQQLRDHLKDQPIKVVQGHQLLARFPRLYLLKDNQL